MSEIVNTLPYSIDLCDTLKKTTLHTLFVMDDKLAHRFELTITSGGKPADLSKSTVTAYFTNFKESTTIKVDGKMENGKAVVQLSEPCYKLHGQFVLFIQIKTGDAETTVFQGDGYMRNCKAEKIIYDDYIIYDVNTLLSQIEEMKRATADAKAATLEMLIVRYDPATQKADKTRTEITDAAAAKKACFAIDSSGNVYNYVGLEPDKNNNNVGYVPTFRKSPDYDDVNFNLSWEELQIQNDGKMRIWGNTNVRTPTPQSLKFTGAVNATYDGSKQITVEIPAGGSGSGGGLPTGGEPNMMLVTDADGNAEWQERTHWKVEGLLDVLPEMTLEGTDGQFSILEPFAGEIVVGNTYTVTYNGTEYTCTAFPLQEGEGAPIMPSVGNQAAIGGEDTGEPFIVAYVPQEIAEMVGGYGIVMDMTGAASATVKIQYDGVVYHKLPNEYLDIPMVNTSSEILPETTFDGEGGEFFTLVPLTEKPFFGKHYTVMWNGASYECIAGEIDLMGEGVYFPAVGDLAAMESGEPTGAYPFMIFFVPSEYVSVMDGVTAGAMALDGSTEVVAKVCSAGGVKIAAEALDLDWIPKLENVGETIFKTSVDDVLVTTIDVTLSDKVAVGDKVIVIYDGVFYEQTAFEYEGVLCIGSAELLAGGFGTQVTGIPVAMGEMDGQTIIKVMTTGAETHTVELYKSGNSQQIAKEKLPSVFLPDMSALHVVITQNDDDTYSSSHNVSDIYKAYLENRPVFCSYDGAGNALAIEIFQLIQIGSYKAVFGRFDVGENQTFTLQSIDGFRVNYRAVRYTEAT